MAPGTEHAGRFVHVKWGDVAPPPVLAPYEYDGFPIVGDDSQLTRTVIVRINGAIDDPDIGYRWKNNYVITEDHYIDYFGGRPAEEVERIAGQRVGDKLTAAQQQQYLAVQAADWPGPRSDVQGWRP
jgi:hypothetical protein